MSASPSVAALVVAAGRGSRFGGETPKQYLPLGGEPVLRHSLRTLSRHPAIRCVRTVIADGDGLLYGLATEGLGLPDPVIGGATRQDSVRLGLEALSREPPDVVLVHDGARPFLDRALLDRLFAALPRFDGVIPAAPVTDTLKRVDGDRILATADRSGLWRAQTPQAFRFAALLAAHRTAAGTSGYTDDAEIAEAAGLRLGVVAGSEDNIKITHPDDLARGARLLAASGETRVGQGFDAHRLGPGTAVRLCGIDLAADAALIGHSDADVALHAVVDALLGAIGAGDIGQHFPPSDARWRGADSATFVAHAAELVRRAGGAIRHVDLTIVCERPRISPHRESMAARLAAILGVERSRVSVKATTTEGMGFAGRGEGIAAQAVATVTLPAAP